jgi:hypothetical protein
MNVSFYASALIADRLSASRIANRTRIGFWYIHKEN